MSTALTSSGETALATIAVPEELREAWDRVASAGHPEALVRALYRVALGEPYREAATAEGYEDHKQVWRAARRHGLANSRKERLLNGQRRVATLATDLLEERLLEKPDEVSSRDLTVASGVAIDKVSAAEGWGKGEEAPSQGPDVGLAALAEAIVAKGGKLELHVTVSTPDDGDPRDVIDLP